MALIVEDGTGLSNSEAYCSETYADDYHEKRGNMTWNSVTDKEAALRKATDYMQQVYRSRWQGLRSVTDQALDWPRSGVVVNDEEIIVPENIIPGDIKKACAELALKTYTQELLEDQGQQVKRKKVDVIEIEYDTYSPQTKRYKAVDAMLSAYFKNVNTSAQVRMVRV